MADSDFPSLARQAAILMTHYGFELEGQAMEGLIVLWLGVYPASWLRAAVVESLYQGRYKARSVEQILAMWARRDRPLRHFNHEFESIICRELPYPEFMTSSGDLLLPEPTAGMTETATVEVRATALPSPDEPLAALPAIGLIEDGEPSYPHSLASETPGLTATDPIPTFAPAPLSPSQSPPLPLAIASEALTSPPPPIDEFIPMVELPPSHAKLQAAAHQPETAPVDESA